MIWPKAGFFSQGGVSPNLTDRRLWRSEVTPTHCGIFGPCDALSALADRFVGRMTVEQEFRDWVEANLVDDPALCAGPQTQCQRVAGQVLSTIATLTGWRPPAPPPPVKRTTRERIQRALDRGGSLAFVFQPPTAAETAAMPPPPPAPEYKRCYRIHWPGGIFFRLLGEPCPPGMTEDASRAFNWTAP